MKHKKLADLFVVLCLFGFLAAALAITVAKPKVNWSYYENRLLAQWTTPTAETISDGSFFSDVEPMLQDHAAGRNTLLKLSTLADLYLLNRPVVNQVVAADGMLLHWLAYDTPNPAAISAQAEQMAAQLAAVRDVVEDYGGQYYYTAVPGQYTYFEDSHPDYLNNRAEYTDLVLTNFARAVEEQDIDLIEMGGVFAALGNPPELYSRVDYHYSMGGAYQTYRSIMERINQNREEPLTVLEDDAIRFETLSNSYLGSRSRKLFGLWDCGEKTDVAWPADPIPFTRTDNGAPGDASVYALPGSTWDQVTYSVYMGGDIGETVIDTGRDELPSVLIYGDSFTNPVECLMYYSFNEMRSIDLRHYREMSLADYIRLHQPDVVICIRDYEVLLSSAFNGDAFSVP